MAISKLLPHVVSVGCLLGLTACIPTALADTTSFDLLNPTLLPQQQKWRVMPADADLSTVKANGMFVSTSTIGANDEFIQLFHRQVPIYVQDGYVVDLWLKVNEVQQPHNTFDAGIVLYASTRDPSQFGFTGSPRAQLIYFDTDGIGWGDESENFALDTINDFHHYRVEVEGDGTARVLVDGEIALQRSDFKAYPHVAFGDMTNEAGLNGRYSVSSLTVTGLATRAWPVDVKPAYCPNPGLDGRSTKSIPISINGYQDGQGNVWDVSQIDPASVRVNGLAPRGWAIRHASRVHGHFDSLGEAESPNCFGFGVLDGILDLVVAFEERALVASIGAPAVPGQWIRLRVTGKLKPEFGGGAFAGEDLVKVYNVPTP